MNAKKLTLPLSEKDIRSLRANDKVLLSGVIHTLRDAGHKRLVQSIKNGSPDIDVSSLAIYYCGPTPSMPNEIIGSCGPTTSARMDDYTPLLLENGLKVMIGKGNRSSVVVDSIKKYRAIYFIAVGVAGALYKSCVKKNTPVLYPDLGCESMNALTIQDMPLLVAIDSDGNSILN